MDFPAEKRIKLSPPEEKAEEIKDSPFHWDRFAKIRDFLYNNTELIKDLIQVVLDYLERELVEGHVTIPVPFSLTGSLLVLSGGRFMICIREDSYVDLIRLEDIAVVGRILLPFFDEFTYPPSLQLDKDHVIFFQGTECCVWNMSRKTISAPLHTVTDENQQVFVMHVDRVPSHGNRVFARKSVSSRDVFLLDISLQDEKPIFHVFTRTIAHAILRAPLVLGDKFLFEEDCPDYYCRIEPKPGMQTWEEKVTPLPGSRRYILGCDDVYLFSSAQALIRWDATESKTHWYRHLECLLLNDMTFEIDRFNDSQLLVWSRRQTGPIAIVSKASGDAFYIEREPDFQVLTCHDGTLIGRVGDEYQVIRFW